ncbi:hypothetical protein ABW21_db0204780 [Orbilia brochopaga]|nr:hypothetical protein ABW21_db0204780 [Drechslerella brochopaga]
MRSSLQLYLLFTLLTTASYAATLGPSKHPPGMVTASASLQSYSLSSRLQDPELTTDPPSHLAQDVSSSDDDNSGSSTATVSTTSKTQDEDTNMITSHVSNSIITRAAALSSPTTFIQNDESGAAPPLPLLNATNITLSCRNYPSKAAVRACNAKIVAPLFVLAYIFALRAVLWLQGLSVRQVLELGERLARCRDSFDGWAWEEQGSWKIRQQPALPGVAMLGVLALQELLNDRSAAGTGNDTKGRERSLDRDYRRRERDRRLDTTPSGSQDRVDGGGTDHRMSEKSRRQDRELNQPMTLQEKARITEMVKAAHKRIMHDTRSKRVVWGVGISLLVIGGCLIGLAILLSVPCKEISRLGTCPFRDV